MPRGISDFSELITKHHCFVDKSLLIQELLQCGDKVVLITRPRRFGKTINLSMLQHFFASSQTGPCSGSDTIQSSHIKPSGQLQPDSAVAKNPGGCPFDNLLIAQNQGQLLLQVEQPLIPKLQAQ